MPLLRVGFGMAWWGRRRLLSLVPHPLHHHPPALTQRGATESGMQSAEGGRGNWSPSGRGLRRWRAAAAAAVGGRVSAIPHSSWEEGPAPAGGPGLCQREAVLWARRPRASLLPVWALCPPSPAPGLLLVWPSLGVCHTGSCLYPASRKTQGHMGPQGGDPSSQRRWELAGGESQSGRCSKPAGGGGSLPQALGEALIWKGSSPGAAVCRPLGSGDRPATCKDHWDVWHVQSPLQAIPGLCGISSQTQVSGVCGH